MYRHFLFNRDFEVAVAAGREFDEEGVPFFRIQSSWITARLKKSRFTRLARNIEYLVNWLQVPKGLVSFCDDFKPDIIFSVVDDWHMGIAWKLSRKLNIPLAVDFQDIFALSTFIDRYSMPYPLSKTFLLNRYRFLNRKSELVFHVGPGMHDWFGSEKRGDLLYPMANGESAPPPSTGSESKNDKFVLTYTGNCRGPYGRMVCQFAKAIADHPQIEFRIYSLGTDIPKSDLDEIVESGMYRGYLPFDKLKHELVDSDAFLLVMSFEPEDEVFVNTSFNTKWVDYVAYSKPIFVWGPAYSSAARFANQEGSAAAVEENDPEALIRKIESLLADPKSRHELARGAQKVSNTILNPNRLQTMLVDRIHEAISPKPANPASAPPAE